MFLKGILSPLLWVTLIIEVILLFDKENFKVVCYTDVSSQCSNLRDFGQHGLKKLGMYKIRFNLVNTR